MLPGSFPGSHNYNPVPIGIIPNNSNTNILIHEVYEKRYRERFLSKRKKSFFTHLNSNLLALLVAFSIIEFIKDSSLSKLVLRIMTQLVGINLISPSFSYIPDVHEVKKFSILLVILCTIYCLSCSVLFGIPENNLNGYLIGDWILLLVGEKVPRTVWELIMYDVIIMILQVVLVSARENFRVKYSSVRTNASGEATNGNSGDANSNNSNDDGIDGEDIEASEVTRLVGKESEYDGMQGNVMVASISLKIFFDVIHDAIQKNFQRLQS